MQFYIILFYLKIVHTVCYDHALLSSQFLWVLISICPMKIRCEYSSIVASCQCLEMSNFVVFHILDFQISNAEPALLYISQTIVL